MIMMFAGSIVCHPSAYTESHYEYEHRRERKKKIEAKATKYTWNHSCWSLEDERKMLEDDKMFVWYIITYQQHQVWKNGCFRLSKKKFMMRNGYQITLEHAYRVFNVRVFCSQTQHPDVTRLAFFTWECRVLKRQKTQTFICDIIDGFILLFFLLLFSLDCLSNIQRRFFEWDARLCSYVMDIFNIYFVFVSVRVPHVGVARLPYWIRYARKYWASSDVFIFVLNLPKARKKKHSYAWDKADKCAIQKIEVCEYSDVMCVIWMSQESDCSCHAKLWAIILYLKNLLLTVEEVACTQHKCMQCVVIR